MSTKIFLNIFSSLIYSINSIIADTYIELKMTIITIILQMLVDLNIVLNNTFEDDIEVQGGMPRANYEGPNGFLNHVIIPIYQVVKAVRFLSFLQICHTPISVIALLIGYICYFSYVFVLDNLS